jgi:hypothetical protein
LHAVDVVRGKDVRAIVDEVREANGRHCPVLWNLTTRESGAPAGR